MTDLQAGKMYEWTMEVALGVDAPHEVQSGMVRYVTDEKGNGISVEAENGAVLVRVFGPDGGTLACLPHYANSVSVRIQHASPSED